MKRILAIAGVAVLFLVGGAIPANAVGYGGIAPFNSHYNYTYAGWDYYWQGKAEWDESCVGHTDVYLSRRVGCPWCQLYTNTRAHCTQV